MLDMTKTAPKLIKLLGMSFSTPSSKRQTPYGEYMCPLCNKPFVAIVWNVNKGNTLSCGCQRYAPKIDPLLHKAGVYQILNTCNNKRYVGSTLHINNRKRTHFSKLSTHNGVNKRIQDDFLLFKKPCFTFIVLEYLDPPKTPKERLAFRKSLNQIEQKWIDKLEPEYNVHKIAGSGVGFKHSKEAIKKISLSGNKPVFQYSLSGKFIKKWSSIKKAAEDLELNSSSVSNCSRGVYKTAGGFKWGRQ
jgi:transcription elongation factor Elf1